MAELGMAPLAVSLAEVQAFARIETGEEEALIAGLVRTASALCESLHRNVAGQAVVRARASRDRRLAAAGTGARKVDRAGRNRCA